MESSLEPLFTIPEVARYLRLSKSQVYSMILRKEIPHVRLGERRVVVRKCDLEKWVDSQVSSIQL